MLKGNQGRLWVGGEYEQSIMIHAYGIVTMTISILCDIFNFKKEIKENCPVIIKKGKVI